MFRRFLSAGFGLLFGALAATTGAAQSLPFSFGPTSSLPHGPDRLTFGILSALCSDCRTVAGSGGPENIVLGRALGFMLAATWLNAAAGGSSSSSAPALAYTFGVEHETNSIDAFRAGAWSFPTSGESTFTGVFLGVAYETPMGGGYSSSSVAVPTFGFGLNLGYGWAAVNGFGGSFRAEESGLYGRADAYLAIPLAGGMLLQPGISYRAFDFGGIEDRGLSGFLWLTVPL